MAPSSSSHTCVYSLKSVFLQTYDRFYSTRPESKQTAPPDSSCSGEIQTGLFPPTQVSPPSRKRETLLPPPPPLDGFNSLGSYSLSHLRNDLAPLLSLCLSNSFEFREVRGRWTPFLPDPARLCTTYCSIGLSLAIKDRPTHPFFSLSLSLSFPPPCFCWSLRKFSTLPRFVPSIYCIYREPDPNSKAAKNLLLSHICLH